MSVSKVICQRKHAKMRASQRYQLTLNKDKLRVICKQIQEGKGAKYVARQSFRVTIWEVTYEGKNLWAVYDRMRHTVVTFLPPSLTRDKIIEQIETGEIDHEFTEMLEK